MGICEEIRAKYPIEAGRVYVWASDVWGSGYEVIKEVEGDRAHFVAVTDGENSEGWANIGAIQAVLDMSEAFPCVYRSYIVHGKEGHRQRASFGPSFSHTWKEEGARVDIWNADRTGSNDYSFVRVWAKTAEDCRSYLEGQLTDGIFENCKVGAIVEVQR